MNTRSFLWIRIMTAMLLMVLAGNANANVWLDENFEDESAFVQRDGAAVGQNGWDNYSANFLLFPVTDTPEYAETGAVSSAKAFQGTKSYRLGVGETLAVGPDYQDPQNGNFQIFQFAINVDPIPAAGTVATFRWSQDLNSLDAPADHIFYVRLDSDGEQVTIVGGEDENNDPPVEAVLGALNSTDDWAYITLLSQKDVADTTDSRFPALGAVPQGMHFFNSSFTPALSVEYEVILDGAYAGRDWSFNVESGAIFLDELYWDGGLDNDAANSNPRPFDLGAVAPTEAKDWIYVD